jgi:hypothetical protein
MSEIKRGSIEPARPTISHDDVIINPELWAQYKDERVALVKAGKPIWMLRGIDAGDTEPAIVLDYYESGGLRGYVEGDDLDGYQVYGPEAEEGRGPLHLNTEPVMLLSEAQKSLADYIKDTYGKFA